MHSDLRHYIRQAGLCRPLLPIAIWVGYSYKASCARPGLAVI